MEARKDEIQHKASDKLPPKEGRPIPPLSAYDIFIHLERKAYMEARESDSSSKVCFTEASFASHVSAKWKNLGTALRIELEEMAKLDQERYDRENQEWMMKMNMGAQNEFEALKSTMLNGAVQKTPFVLGKIPQCESVPAKKRMSVNKTSLSGITFPDLPFEAAPGPRRNTGRNAQFTRSLLAVYQDEGVEVAQPEASYRVTPFQERPTLQAATVRYSPRPTENAPFASAPEASTGVSSQPNASATSNDASDNAIKSNESQVTHVDKEELQYMRGYIQGYKMQPDFAAAKKRFIADNCIHLIPSSFLDEDDSAGRSGFQRVKDEDVKDRAFMRGFAQGYKMASQMWSTPGASEGGWYLY
jgi:hypothetical protein